MFNIFFKTPPKSFNNGFIDCELGHKVYFHEYGNKMGPAIVVFHGGPGSKSKPKHASLFNLKKFRVILFDQRGTGNSIYTDRFKNNNTNSILLDTKALLDKLEIKTIKIVSGSWGSTLALLFAETYPEMVSEMILYSIFLGRKEDIKWISNGTKIFYPDLFKLIEIKPENNFIAWNYNHIFSKSMNKQNLATKKFGSYERNLGSLNPHMSMEYIPSQEHRDGFKLYMHYLYNDFFMSENQILKNIAKIKNINVTIIHNRIDMITPLKGAWDLHLALPKSKINIVDDIGHGTNKQMKIVKETLYKLQ